jgi:2-polyprenyl-6-methoxyphenol hydroxylase-like FAD-dependent oxidoreductase
VQLWDGYASIVWSTTPDHAAALLTLSPPEFAAALNTVLTAPTATFAAALAGDAAPPPSTPAPAGAADAEAAAAAAAAYQATLYNKARDTIFLDPLWALHRAGSALVDRLVAQQTAASAAPPLRAPPRIAGIVGPRAAFPLRFQSASAYTAPRVALVG